MLYHHDIFMTYSTYDWCCPCVFLETFDFLRGMNDGNQIWRDMFWPMASGDESPRNRLLKTDDVISLHDQKLGKQLWLWPIQKLKFSRLWLWRFPDLFLLWLFLEFFLFITYFHAGQQSVSLKKCVVHVAMHKVNQVVQILFDFRFQRFRPRWTC